MGDAGQVGSDRVGSGRNGDTRCCEAGGRVSRYARVLMFLISDTQVNNTDAFVSVSVDPRSLCAAKDHHEDISRSDEALCKLASLLRFRGAGRFNNNFNA